MATTEANTIEMDSVSHQTDDGFIPRKTRPRKRKLPRDKPDDQQAMETSESAPKRPVFPPISGDKLTVNILIFHNKKTMMMTQNLNNTHKSKIRCQNCTNQLRFFL
jgi:hypothetical protein